MKTRQAIVRMMMALTVTFGVQLTASAQLGKLKGLANKAKSTVGKATSGAADKVNNVTGQTDAEFAADQQARLRNETPASTVTWRWEDNKAEYYPLMHWQGAKTEAFAEQLLDLYLGLYQLFTQNEFQAGRGRWLNYVPLKGTDKYVPSDEYLRYAWTKNFVDDPSWPNFLYFCYVLPFRADQFNGFYQYLLEDGAKGIIRSKDKMFLPWEDWTKMTVEQMTRENFAIELAAKKMPLDKVCERAKTLANASYNNYKKQVVDEGQLWNMYQAVAIWKKLVPMMGSQSSDVVRDLEATMNNYGKIIGHWGLIDQMINVYRLGKLGVDKGVLPTVETIWQRDIPQAVSDFVDKQAKANDQKVDYEMVAYSILSEQWKQTDRIFSKAKEAERIRLKEPKNEEIPVKLVFEDHKNNNKLTLFTGYILRHGLAAGRNEDFRSREYIFIATKSEPVEYR